MKYITLVIFVFALVLFRPYELNTGGFWYADDDWDYFAHASSIAYGQFPSYEKEFFLGDGVKPLGGIGSGILASPFVFVFSLVDRVLGADIVLERTEENIPGSWSQFGFIVASLFYLYLSCWLLYKAVRYFCDEPASVWAVMLMALCQGLPLYVFRRPIFSHVFEFFLQSVFVYLLVLFQQRDIISKKMIVLIATSVAMTILVRTNNVFMALFWPMILFFNGIKDGKNISIWKKIILVYVLAVIMVFGLKIVPELLNPSGGYGGDIKARLLTFEPIAFYFKRFVHILFGINWGLLYTAPFIVVAGLALFIQRYPLKHKLIWATLPMLINLYCVIAWRTQGGWYGYRYLIFALMPLLVIPLAHFIDQCKKRMSVWPWILSTVAVFPILSMVAFEASGGALHLSVADSGFGQSGWDNPHYQVKVWEIFLFYPLEALHIVFDAGVFYILNILAKLVHAQHLLSAAMIKNYLVFDWGVLIKTMIVYALPFGLYGAYRRFNYNEHSV